MDISVQYALISQSKSALSSTKELMFVDGSDYEVFINMLNTHRSTIKL